MEAKKAQVQNMQEYIAGCQAFFEKVLTELLLRQPDDPAEFLQETLEAMPAEEKAQWTKKVTNQAVAAGVPAPRPQTSAAGRSTETVPLTADTVQVVLKLALNPGDDIKSEVFFRSGWASGQGQSPARLPVLRDL
mmetsp:Transcript_13334/g.25889  ORF Transcript_13334/g.25889 Transcript_13334/m.25889 type:complete len:135 (-) Transcript_13334:420-824(-)